VRATHHCYLVVRGTHPTKLRNLHLLNYTTTPPQPNTQLELN